MPLLPRLLWRLTLLLIAIGWTGRSYAEGARLDALAGVLVSVGVGSALLPRPLLELASACRYWWRERTWAREEGRWHTFRGRPVAVREHQGAVWVRCADVAAVWGEPLPPDEPARLLLPGEPGDYVRASLVGRVLIAREPMPDPRRAAFLKWLEALQPRP